MFESEHRMIQTVSEALKAGYEQMPDFYTHPLAINRLLDAMPFLNRYAPILRYSFIIVQQDFGYCLWRRVIQASNN